MQKIRDKIKKNLLNQFNLDGSHIQVPSANQTYSTEELNTAYYQYENDFTNKHAPVKTRQPIDKTFALY